jgi:predicted dehydrogenase
LREAPDWSRGNSGDTAADDLERTQASMAEIRAAVKSAGVTFCYAENWVYAPAMTRTKELLSSSGGSIMDIRAEEGHSGSHSQLSRSRATAGGGSLMTLGAHPIAAAIHLKTYEASLTGVHIGVDWVAAQTARLHESEAARRSPGHGWIISEWEDVETWANLVLGFSDGSRAVVTASFAMLGGVRNTFGVYATNTVIRADMTSNNSLTAFTPDPAAFLGEDLREKLETNLGWNSVEVDGGWARGYPQEMQDFVNAITSGRQPASGLQLACDVIEVIYSAYASAAGNCRVPLGLSLQATS